MTTRQKSVIGGAVAVLIVGGGLVLLLGGSSTDATLSSIVPKVVTILQSGNFPRICTLAAPDQVSTCHHDLRGVSNGTIISYKDIRTGEIRTEGNRALVVITGSVCLDGQACRSNRDPHLEHSRSFDQVYAQEVGSGNSSSFVVPFTRVGGQWYVGGY
jgi:hypothetical protein